jgi:plasmid stabilization system protein ParE
MAEKPRKVTLSFLPAAQTALRRIWNWNANRYGENHADRYIAFLIATTEKLVDDPSVGKPISKVPTMHYITIRRSRKGHGHVAVYEIVDGVIQVVDFFHTAQDWQSKLIDEEP